MNPSNSCGPLPRPAQGRWLSPDPSRLAAVNGACAARGGANPQAWNAYAYVANQPLTATDPLGLDCSQDPKEWGQPIPGTGPCIVVSQTVTVTASGGPGPIVSFVPSAGFGGGVTGGGVGRAGMQTERLPPELIELAASLTKIKTKICDAVPSGRVEGVSGSVGGVGGAVGGGDIVLNYNSGQVSAVGYGGVQVGWSGGASGSAYTGFVYGLSNSNSNYSGGFAGFNLAGGAGVFGASSSGGLTGGAAGLVPNFRVAVAGAVFGGGLLGGASGGPSFTNYSPPAQLGKLWAFSGLDFALYAARQVCK